MADELTQWHSTQANQWHSTQANQWHDKDASGITLPAMTLSGVFEADISLYTILPPLNPKAVFSASIYAGEESIKIPNAIILYDALLGDLTIPITLFTASRSSATGGLSELSVTTYRYDLLGDINDRLTENLTLRKHYEVDGVIVKTDVIMVVNEITVKHLTSGTSKTISITGDRDEILINRVMSISESYQDIQNKSGKKEISYYTINPDIKPGDTLIVDGAAVIVGRISMSFSFGNNGRYVNEIMTISEE